MAMVCQARDQRALLLRACERRIAAQDCAQLSPRDRSAVQIEMQRLKGAIESM